MDHTRNRDDDKDRSRSEDPQDPGFAWDDMKAGIFERMRAEDPHFFEQRRRRRVPVWLWFGAAALLLGGITRWWLTGGPQADGPTPPRGQNPAQPAEHRPVATDTRPPGVEIRTTETHPARPAIFTHQDKGKIPTQAPGSHAGHRQVDQAASHTGKGTDSKRREPDFPGFEDPDPLSPRPTPQAASPYPLPIPGQQALRTNTPRPTAGGGLNPGSPAAHDGPPDHRRKAPRKVTATGGPSLSLAKFGGAAAAAGLRNDHSTPVSGYRLGLEAWLPLGAGGHLLFGLDRQAHRQYIDISTERPFDTLLQDIVLATTHHIVGNYLSDTRGDTLVTAIQKNRLAKYNRFRSVQVQAGYARTVAVKKWLLSPFAGLSAGYLTRQDGWSVASDQSIFPFGNERPILRRLQLKTMAGAQAERPLPGPFSLVLRYQADKAWTNGSLEQGLVWRPATHNFSVGLAWDW